MIEREAVRAIIEHDGALLLMKRRKQGRRYYTLVGGHIEPGEDAAGALIREVAEETGLTASKLRLVYVQEPVGRYNTQYIYTATSEGTTVGIRPDADEHRANLTGDNTYEPEWVPLADVDSLPLFPTELKRRLLQDIYHSWPEKPITITPQGD